MDERYSFPSRAALIERGSTIFPQVVCRKMFPMPSGNLRHGAGDARQGSGVPRGLLHMRLMRHPAEQGRSFRAEGRPGLL